MRIGTINCAVCGGAGRFYDKFELVESPCIFCKETGKVSLHEFVCKACGRKFHTTDNTSRYCSKWQCQSKRRNKLDRCSSSFCPDDATQRVVLKDQYTELIPDVDYYNVSEVEPVLNKPTIVRSVKTKSCELCGRIFEYGPGSKPFKTSKAKYCSRKCNVALSNKRLAERRKNERHQNKQASQ